jgi:hypothetical protein
MSHITFPRHPRRVCLTFWQLASVWMAAFILGFAVCFVLLLT